MAALSLIEHFAALEDPRQSWKVLFPLPEILLLVLCGTLAGAEDFVEIRRWGQMHQDFLRRLLPFAAGIPSHDTLNDVINALDGTLFTECFTAWVETLREPAPAASAPEVVAIDGKTSRRTHDRSRDRGPLHMVSAWASSQRLVLGQQACEAKSNEITAIPLLLERLALTGALVTIDAMGDAGQRFRQAQPDGMASGGCQTKIAQAVLDRGGDYLLAVKDNQPSLHDEIRRYLDDPAARVHSRFETTDADHGRIEVRRHLVSHDVDWLTGAFPKSHVLQACAPSPSLTPRSSAMAAPASNGATICPPCRSTPRCSPTPCAATGTSRTGCTGCSMSSFTRTSAACDPAPGRKTWPPSGIWP